MAPLDRRRRNRELLDLLLEKASIQGYLTSDDLMDVSPEVSEDAERLSVIMLALRHRGVEVVDPDDDFTQSEPISVSGFQGLEEPEPCDYAGDYAGDDTVGMYLKEMSRVPLLKAEEEYEIAIRIEDGRKARKDLLFPRPAGVSWTGSAWKPWSRMGSWPVNISLRLILAWSSVLPSVIWAIASIFST